MPDLSIPQGAKREFTIPVTQGRGGEPYDLTDADTVVLTAKHRTSDADGDAVFVKSLGSGLAAPAPTTGGLVLTVSPDDTEALSPHTALVYDLWITETDGDPYPVQKGRIFITQRVSDPT